MVEVGKVRLNRLFNISGKCLDVAVDHGIFNEYSFLDGLQDMNAVVTQLVDAGPDAIQMNYGQADVLQTIPGKRKPALVMRTDIGNPYNPQTHKVMFNILQNDEEPILEAIRLDAACVVANLLLLPNEPDLHRQTIVNISRLRGVCEKYGMPLMVEPLVMSTNDVRGGYQVDGDKNKLVPLVRQARELGADIIKADPTDNVADYHRVIEVAAGRPVLVRGGGKVPDGEILQRTFDLMQQGARGIVYGRNVIQHRNQAGMTRSLMAVVHEGATAEQAFVAHLQA